MNYIKIINKFWASIEEDPLKTTDIALYFYLLKVSNDALWRNPFKRNNRKIEADLNISYKVLASARNRLKELKLIDFEALNGNPNVTYTLAFKDELRAGYGTSKDKLKEKLKDRDPPLPPLTDAETETETETEAPPWKEDIETYREELRQAYKAAMADEAWIAQRERYNPNIEVRLTLEKACVDYWATEAGWEHKRKADTRKINWRKTFNTALSVPSNHVYKPRKNQRNEPENQETKAISLTL